MKDCRFSSYGEHSWIRIGYENGFCIFQCVFCKISKKEELFFIDNEIVNCHVCHGIIELRNPLQDFIIDGSKIYCSDCFSNKGVETAKDKNKRH